MAPAPAGAAGSRRSRQTEKRVFSDDDSEHESDAPRPQKLRKRISEAYVPDVQSPQDASFTAENDQRVPLKSVNINDDDAERRRRRKSAKMTTLDNAVAGPSSEGGAAANGDADTSRPGHGRRQQPLNAVAATPALPKQSIEAMTTNFEEWMKMATDNKINATNSWNFALIDYFHDMSLLRNNDDNSINFQRASCTLDGCVKIWTSRVDSVGTETGKLLSNLASGGHDDGDGNDSDNPDGESQPKKKKASRPANNLAKDYGTLTNKKLDLEFSVDPLFKKTCADFDEGGASGLLLNHLSLGLGSDGGMRVIFDASDSVFEEETDVVDAPEDLIDISALRQDFLPDFTVLEDKVISRSLASFAFGKAFDPDGDHDDQIPTTQYSINDDDDDGDPVDGPNAQFDMDVDGAPVEDFFAGAEAINEDFGYSGGGGDDYGDGEGGGSAGSGGEMGQDGAEVVGTGPFVPFDPRNAPNGKELVLAMTGGDGDENAFDYFDSKYLKNWAGPEHWRRKPFRKGRCFYCIPCYPYANVLVTVTVAATDGDGATKADTKGKGRSKAEPQTIDFLAPSEKSLKDMADELFAPPGKGQTINLPGTGVSAANKRGSKRKKGPNAAKKDEHLLPDDMHFSSKQLVTLFLKPKFVLKMRGKRARMNADSGEVDDEFWVQTAGEEGRGGEDEPGMGGDGSDGNIPFNTQFFNDDFDDGFDPDGGITAAMGGMDGDMGVDPSEQDLLAATAGQTRRVKPEFVNYAKRAKRVDVRKLKENIWKGLDIIVIDDDDEHSMDIDEDDRERSRRAKSTKPPTDPTEARQFSQVISGLTKSYPKDKLDEISTSFCFICLLHLANEQGLKLESDQAIEDIDDDAAEKSLRRGRSVVMQVEGDEEDEVRDTIIPDDEEDLIAAGVGPGVKVEDDWVIGNIWDIKIYRDPNATRSA